MEQRTTLVLLPTRVLGLPRSIAIDQRPGEKFRQGFTGAAAGVKTSKRFPAHLFPERASWYLIEDEDMGGSRGRAGAVFGGLPTPSVVLSAGGRRSPLLLLLTLQKWQLGFWSFCILSRICPDCSFTVIFDPLEILGALSLEKTFVQVPALQQRVPACLLRPLCPKARGAFLRVTRCSWHSMNKPKCDD